MFGKLFPDIMLSSGAQKIDTDVAFEIRPGFERLSQKS